MALPNVRYGWKTDIGHRNIAVMGYLFLWLRRVIDAIDRKIDRWWRDKPTLDQETARYAKHQMERELAEAVGAWERSADATGGDGE